MVSPQACPNPTPRPASQGPAASWPVSGSNSPMLKSRPHSPRPADRPAVSPLPPRTRTLIQGVGRLVVGHRSPAPAGDAAILAAAIRVPQSRSPHPARAPTQPHHHLGRGGGCVARPSPGARQTLTSRQIQQPHGLVGAAAMASSRLRCPAMSEGALPASYSMEAGLQLPEEAVHRRILHPCHTESSADLLPGGSADHDHKNDPSGVVLSSHLA